MRLGPRILRVLSLLLIALAVPLVVASVASRVAGDRIYLLNATNCNVSVIEQHDGKTAAPGELILVKAGFVDRTPTLLITSNSVIWYGGLHFSTDIFQNRGEPDVPISSAWRVSSMFGTKQIYELRADGLFLRSPTDPIALPQPVGFPVIPRGGSKITCGGA